MLSYVKSLFSRKRREPQIIMVDADELPPSLLRALLETSLKLEEPQKREDPTPDTLITRAVDRVVSYYDDVILGVEDQTTAERCHMLGTLRGVVVSSPVPKKISALYDKNNCIVPTVESVRLAHNPVLIEYLDLCLEAPHHV